MIRLFVLLLIIQLFNLGCSTLKHNGHRQQVLVQSEPSGAGIFLKNKKLGETPAIVDIPRGLKKKKLVLSHGNEKKSYTLNSKFRWIDSGLANLIFVNLYSVGVLVDVVSGYGWEVDEEVFLDFGSSEKGKLNSTLVIAPPQGPNEFWAPEIANSLKRYLELKYPKYRILPYSMTESFFEKHNYDFHQRPIVEQQKELHGELFNKVNAEFVAESFYEPSKNKVNLYTEIIRVNNREVITQHNTSVRLKNIKRFKQAQWKTKAGTVFHLIPNNIAVMNTTSHAEIELQGANFSKKKIKAEDRPIDGIVGDMSKVLGAFSVNLLSPPTSRKKSRTEFSFVPSLVLSWARFEFKETLLLEEVVFDNFSVGGGYGPQWSLVSNWGKSFLEILPTLFYNDLRWKPPGKKQRDLKNLNLGVQTRFGHTLFLNDHLNLTLFVQNTSENQNAWQEAIDDVSGTANSVKVSSSTRVFTGIALGYYFPVFDNPIGSVYE